MPAFQADAPLDKVQFQPHLGRDLRRWRSRCRGRHRRRITAPERAISGVVLVQPAQTAAGFRWCVGAWFHSVIVMYICGIKLFVFTGYVAMS